MRWGRLVVTTFAVVFAVLAVARPYGALFAEVKEGTVCLATPPGDPVPRRATVSHELDWLPPRITCVYLERGRVVERRDRTPDLRGAFLLALMVALVVLAVSLVLEPLRRWSRRLAPLG